MTIRAVRLRAEQLAEPLEQVPAEYGLFAEARDDNHGPHRSRERCRISDEIMIGLIYWVGPEKRHNDRLHEEFERDAERDAEGQASNPAFGSNVADFAPWRARQSGPHKNQHCAEWRQNLPGSNEEDGENAQRPESPQLSGKTILG